MSGAEVPAWEPPSGQEPQLQLAGQCWDVIRVPEDQARKVQLKLGSFTGVIFADRWSYVWYWLVPVGTAETWDVPRTRALGAGAEVMVPTTNESAPERGVSWRVRPAPGRYLTDPERLREALETTS